MKSTEKSSKKFSRKVKKAIYVAIGCISTGLGAVGTVLPILPTVPFICLAAFCFARSSDRLNNWLRGTKMYKNNFESFAKGEGMTLRTKIKILATVTLLMVIAFTIMMIKHVVAGCIALGVVWVAHIIAFVFFIKTKKEDTPDIQQEKETEKAVEQVKTAQDSDQ